MLIGFTGTRKGMTPKQHDTVEAILREYKPFTVVHGDCIGADAQFHDIARMLGIIVHVYPSNLTSQRAFTNGFEASKPLPPLVRNKLIVRDSDLMLAAPSGYREQLRSGTWSTIRYAEKQGKAVGIVYPDGIIRFDGSRPAR